jgi:hypothetical protein
VAADDVGDRLLVPGRQAATAEKRGALGSSLHFNGIADPGSCGKARVVPQNRRPDQGTADKGDARAPVDH